MWGVCLLVVVFERDLGSTVLFTIFLLMLYVATGRFSYVIIGLALLAVGAVGAYKFCRTFRCVSGLGRSF